MASNPRRYERGAHPASGMYADNRGGGDDDDEDDAALDELRFQPSGVSNYRGSPRASGARPGRSFDTDDVVEEEPAGDMETTTEQQRQRPPNFEDPSSDGIYIRSGGDFGQEVEEVYDDADDDSFTGAADDQPSSVGSQSDRDVRFAPTAPPPRRPKKGVRIAPVAGNVLTTAANRKSQAAKADALAKKKFSPARQLRGLLQMRTMMLGRRTYLYSFVILFPFFVIGTSALLQRYYDAVYTYVVPADTAPTAAKLPFRFGLGTAAATSVLYTQPTDLQSNMDLNTTLLGFDDAYSSFFGLLQTLLFPDEASLVAALSSDAAQQTTVAAAVVVNSWNNTHGVADLRIYYNESAFLLLPTPLTYPGVDILPQINLLDSMLFASLASNATGPLVLAQLFKDFPRSSDSPLRLNVDPAVQVSALLFCSLSLLPLFTRDLLAERKRNLRYYLGVNGVWPLSYFVSWWAPFSLAACAQMVLMWFFSLVVGFASLSSVSVSLAMVICVCASQLTVCMSFLFSLVLSSSSGSMHRLSTLVSMYCLLGATVLLASVLSVAEWVDEPSLASNIQLVNVLIPAFALARVFYHAAVRSATPYAALSLSNISDPSVAVLRLLESIAGHCLLYVLLYFAHEILVSETFGFRSDSILARMLSDHPAESGYDHSPQRQDMHSVVSYEPWSEAPGADGDELLHPGAASVVDAKDEVALLLVPSSDAAPGGVALSSTQTPGAASENTLVMSDISASKPLSDGFVSRLQSFDCVVRRGEFVCIYAPPWSGKSLLAAILADDVPIDSGMLLFDGKPWLRTRSQRRTDIGISPAFICVPEDLTAKEFLQTMSRARGLSEAVFARAAKAVLDVFRLTRNADTLISRFTSMMKRRLQLAGACIGAPKLVVVDDTMRLMKPFPRGVCLLALDSLRQMFHTSVVYLTSDPQEALALGDQSLLLQRGVLRASGRWSDLFGRFGRSHLLAVVMDSLLFEDEISSFIATVAPEAVPFWVHGATKFFAMPTDAVRYSFLFQLMETNAARLHIQDWFITLYDVQRFVEHLSRGLE